MTVVQTSGTNAGSGTSTSRTFSPAPTAGHLLVAALSSSGVPAGFDGPDGYDLLASLESGNLRAYVYGKIAAGDEGVVPFAWTSGGGFGSVRIVEFDDVVDWPPIVAENEASAATVVTSISTGTATATASAGIAVAFVATDGTSTVDGGRTWSNGFTELSFDGSGTRSALIIATKPITAPGDYSTTFSCTDTGDEMFAAIALFQVAEGDVPVVLSAAGAAVPLLAGAGAIAAGSSVLLSAAGARVPLEAGAAAISIGTSVVLSAAGASIGLFAGAAGVSIGSSVLLSAAGAVVALFAGSAAILIGSGVPTNPALFDLAARNVGHSVGWALRQLVIAPLVRGRRIVARRSRTVDGGSR